MIRIVVEIEGKNDKNIINFTVKKNETSTKDETESANNFAKGLLYLCGGVVSISNIGK